MSNGSASSWIFIAFAVILVFTGASAFLFGIKTSYPAVNTSNLSYFSHSNSTGFFENNLTGSLNTKLQASKEQGSSLDTGSVMVQGGWETLKLMLEIPKISADLLGDFIIVTQNTIGIDIGGYVGIVIAAVGISILLSILYVITKAEP